MIHAALKIALGSSLFLLVILVYGRMTVADPFLYNTAHPKIISTIIAALHFGLVILLWSRSLRMEGLRDVSLVVAGYFIIWYLIWVVSAYDRIPFEDLLRIHLNPYVWWITLLLSAVIHWGEKKSNALEVPWMLYWVVGVVSFIVGILTYVFGSKGVVEMLAKITLILIVPVACLVLTAVEYRGKQEILIRTLAVLGSIAGTAAVCV